MSSYLEAYGAAEQHRAHRMELIKYISIALVCLLVVGLVLYGIFKNYSEERQVKTFTGLLAAHDYQNAYKMWGCTDSHPCPAYPFNKFMEDWGPQSAHAGQATAHIGLSQTCGSGVVIRVDYQRPEEAVALWVERDSGVLSFAPWPECPGPHLHFGSWLRSIFGG